MHSSVFSPFRSGIQRKLLTRRVEIGVVTLTMTLIVLTCILSILLLFHSNKVATKGYQLKALRGEHHDLALLNERFKGEIASRQALNKIQESEYVQNNLVDVGDIVIMEKSGSNLVSR